MAPNGVNGVHDDEDIDYSDIEAKYVCLIAITFSTLRLFAVDIRSSTMKDSTTSSSSTGYP